MHLNHAQKLEFYQKGYLRVPGAVPAVMVDAAVKAINHSFGNGIDPAKMITFQSRTFCPELREAPEITDLYNQTPVKALAESMMGNGKVNPVHGRPDRSSFSDNGRSSAPAPSPFGWPPLARQRRPGRRAA